MKNQPLQVRKNQLQNSCHEKEASCGISYSFQMGMEKSGNMQKGVQKLM